MNSFTISGKGSSGDGVTTIELKKAVSDNPVLKITCAFEERPSTRRWVSRECRYADESTSY
jgi:hypothetical protein